MQRVCHPVSWSPESSGHLAVEVRGLVKDFSVGLRGVKLRAVDHLNLRIEAGQVYGLLGPNGSGKSTTIKALLGLIEPSAGECRIFGTDSRAVASRREVGYLPEAPNFYRHLSGRELVRFYGRMCGVTEAALPARIDDVLATVGLADHADRAVGTYSKGMLQRIGLAQALVHDPRLLILDEPTAGVDPVGTAEISDLIRALKARGKTILITSHLLAQIEEVCDRIAILDRGRLLLEQSVADMVGAGAAQALIVDALPDTDVAALRAWLAERGRNLRSIEAPRPRLDRVFLEQIKGGRA
jgi:ABC-2 type transport system ATP-binding protein